VPTKRKNDATNTGTSNNKKRKVDGGGQQKRKADGGDQQKRKVVGGDQQNGTKKISRFVVDPSIEKPAWGTSLNGERSWRMG